jgi:hypothetical protein
MAYQNNERDKKATCGGTEALEGPFVLSTQAACPCRGGVCKNYCKDWDSNYISGLKSVIKNHCIFIRYYISIFSIFPFSCPALAMVGTLGGGPRKWPKNDTIHDSSDSAPLHFHRSQSTYLTLHYMKDIIETMSTMFMKGYGAIFLSGTEGSE